MSYNFLPESLEIIENPYENGVAGFSRKGGGITFLGLAPGLCLIGLVCLDSKAWQLSPCWAAFCSLLLL